LLVVDNHALLRAAIRSMLSREPDLEVVGEASQRIGERHYQERNQGGWRTGPFLG
jgi:DNA-binding NarL/FixJ family response regulator